MKFILLFALLFISPKNEMYVYICMGPNAKCYHKSKKCEGIRSCSKVIKKVTLDDAIDKYERRPCGYCYKHKKGSHALNSPPALEYDFKIN